MAREAREMSNSGIYYIKAEGAFGITLFKDEDDCLEFLKTLKTASEKNTVKIFAYCLDKNSLYLLVKENLVGSLGTFMQGILSSYAVKFNRKYLRRGGITADRYKSIVVSDFEEALRISVYINNLSAEKFRSSLYDYIETKESEVCDTAYILGEISKDEYKNLLSKKLVPDKNFKIKKLLSEAEIFKLIEKTSGMNPKEIANLEKEKRGKILKKIHQKCGITVAQISRATNISRGIISRSIEEKKEKAVKNSSSPQRRDLKPQTTTPAPKKAEDIWLF